MLSNALAKPQPTSRQNGENMTVGTHRTAFSVFWPLSDQEEAINDPIWLLIPAAWGTISTNDQPAINGTTSMSSRDRILKKLRRAQSPFTEVSPPTQHQPMTPIDDTSPAALRARFITEAQAISMTVTECENDTAAINAVCDLVGADQKVLSWDADRIPLAGLHTALNDAGVQVAAHDDSDVRVGITGADAALAATGSLVLMSGPGQYRTVSLLPDLHIVILKADRIIPTLESWFAAQRADDLTAFRVSSNITLVSGPSKTADIAQELIKGAHGPRAVHILLVD